jgi:hypothetical protein
MRPSLIQCAVYETAHNSPRTRLEFSQPAVTDPHPPQWHPVNLHENAESVCYLLALEEAVQLQLGA